MLLAYRAELLFLVCRSSVLNFLSVVEATALADVEFLLVAIVVKPAVQIADFGCARFGKADIFFVPPLGGETVLVGKVVVRLSRQPVVEHHRYGCV